MTVHNPFKNVFLCQFFFVLSDRDYTLTGKTLGITNTAMIEIKQNIPNPNPISVVTLKDVYLFI